MKNVIEYMSNFNKVYIDHVGLHSFLNYREILELASPIIILSVIIKYDFFYVPYQSRVHSKGLVNHIQLGRYFKAIHVSFRKSIVPKNVLNMF